MVEYYQQNRLLQLVTDFKLTQGLSVTRLSRRPRKTVRWTDRVVLILILGTTFSNLKSTSKKCIWSNKRFELQRQPNQRPETWFVLGEINVPVYCPLVLTAYYWSIVQGRKQHRAKKIKIQYIYIYKCQYQLSLIFPIITLKLFLVSSMIFLTKFDDKT